MVTPTGSGAAIVKSKVTGVLVEEPELAADSAPTLLFRVPTSYVKLYLTNAAAGTLVRTDLRLNDATVRPATLIKMTS